MSCLRTGRGRLVGLVVVGLAAVAALPAAAKTPGLNGRIAFDRANRTGDNFTYTANPDGTHVRPLFPAYPSESPHWSPDGRKIAVISGLGKPCPPTCTGNTVIVDADTGKYRVVPSRAFPALSTFCSIWSPDATHFACEGGNDKNPSVRGIYTIRSSDGGGLTRITHAGNAFDVPIDYSPDGKRIVFGRDNINHECDGRSALYVVSVDGSGLHRITPLGFCDDDGSWSPNGKEIAFERNGSLFVVHPDGKRLRSIPLSGSHGIVLGGDFSWSPNGKRIAFLFSTPNGTRKGIGTANADGTHFHQVTITRTFDHETDWGSHPLVR
jgi:Tol biopolymer transport system component